MYDITDRDSLAKVSEWMSDVDLYTTENIPIILLGNKIDQEDKRQVSYDEGKDFADYFKV